MASAAPPKRMVSSVFITLAAPHRATGTQQQPALQAHTALPRNKQDRSAGISSGDYVPALRHKTENHSTSSPDSYSSVNSKDWTHERPQSLRHTQTASSKAQLQEEKFQKKRSSPGIHDQIVV